MSADNKRRLDHPAKGSRSRPSPPSPPPLSEDTLCCVLIKSVTGEIQSLVVDERDTIADLKAKIQEIAGTPKDQQRWLIELLTGITPRGTPDPSSYSD